MVARVKWVKRNLYPAHHEVVLNPNICSATALMRCCPGRDVQALALSATSIFSQAVSFLLTFSTTGESWVLRVPARAQEQQGEAPAS